jgi:hypothetical protein
VCVGSRRPDGTVLALYTQAHASFDKTVEENNFMFWPIISTSIESHNGDDGNKELPLIDTAGNRIST